MRQARVVVVVALWLAGALLPAAAAQGGEPDHAELRALRDQLVEAVGKLDADAMAPLFTKDFTVTMVDQTHVASTAQVRDFFERTFKADGSVVTAVRIQPEADVLTRFLDGETAVNHGRSRDTYTLRRGGEVTLDSRWTATFRKEDGRWKFAAIHAGVNMLDNPILTAASSGKYAWGGGGLLLGVVLGAMLGRRRAAG